MLYRLIVIAGVLCATTVAVAEENGGQATSSISVNDTTLDLAREPGIHDISRTINSRPVSEELVVLEVDDGAEHKMRYAFTNRGATLYSALMLHPRYTRDPQPAVEGIPFQRVLGGPIDLVSVWDNAYLPFRLRFSDFDGQVTRIVQKAQNARLEGGTLSPADDTKMMMIDRGVMADDEISFQAPAILAGKKTRVVRVNDAGSMEISPEGLPSNLPESLDGVSYTIQRSGRAGELFAKDFEFTRISEGAELPIRYVWPDPNTDSSEMFLEKRFEKGSHPYELKMVITMHNFSKNQMRYRYDVRLNAWQNPFVDQGGSMFSVPTNLLGSSCRTADGLEHEDVGPLQERSMEPERVFQFMTHSSWVGVGTPYFMLAVATATPQRYSCQLAGQPIWGGQGGALVMATLQSNSQTTLSPGDKACLPSWHKAVQGRMSCAEATAILGHKESDSPVEVETSWRQKQSTLRGDELAQAREAFTAYSSQQQHNERYTLFLGAKERDNLVASGHHLEEGMDFGWLVFLSNGMHSLLHWFYGWAGHWALAIILLTILVKSLLLPLTNKSFKAMQQMQKLKPEMDAIKERCGDDRQLMNQEMMGLYKRHKVNPLSGCLPMLVQMPIWIALYQMILSTVELYHVPMGLWIDDLSAPDPYYILPIVLGLLMLIQNTLVSATGTATGMQAKMLKWGMPIMFGLFMLFLPSGLVLYILVNTVLTIIQNVFIRRRIA